jgi:hypothetical protein
MSASNRHIDPETHKKLQRIGLEDLFARYVRNLEPKVGFRVILWYATPGAVQVPKTKLRCKVPLLHRFAKPQQRVDIVLWYTAPEEV